MQLLSRLILHYPPSRINWISYAFWTDKYFKRQMLNLIESNEGVNIILKQNNNSIKKDKFSAFEYGLYYAKLDEERKRKRKSHSIADMMFFS